MKQFGSTVIDASAPDALRDIRPEWCDGRIVAVNSDLRGSERLSQEQLGVIAERDRESRETRFKSPDAACTQGFQDRRVLLDEVMSLRNRLRWLPVTESVPADMYTVLVWITGPENLTSEDPFAEIGVYNPERRRWQCYLYGEERDVEVSHWLVLPEPPDAAAAPDTDQ